jgi:beta-lactamase regulating signal transducer with metallopeptidase domain
MMTEWLLRIGGTSLGLSAVIIVVLVMRALAGRRLPAKSRYALWAPVVLFLAASALIPSQWRLKLGVDAPGQALPAASSEASLPGPGDRESGADREGMSQAGNAASMTTESVDAGEGSASRNDGAARAASGSAPWRLDRVLGFLYAGGVVVFGLYFFLLYWTIRRRIDRLERIGDPALNGMIAEESKRIGLRRPPAALDADGFAEAPEVFGIFRPRIILPNHVLSALRPERLRFIIRHELTHVRRLDNLGNVIGAVIIVLSWFNPLVWIAKRCATLDREEACDQEVLARSEPGREREYVNTIVELLDHLIRRGNPRNRVLMTSAVFFSLWISPVGNKTLAVKRRISMILLKNRKSMPSLVAVMGAAILAMGLAMPVLSAKGVPEKAGVEGLLERAVLLGYEWSKGSNGAYWIGDEKTSLSNGFGFDVALSGRDVYVAGTVFKPVIMPVYWKNGRLVKLSVQSPSDAPMADNGAALGVAVVSGKAHIVGWTRSKEAFAAPAYWVDGKRTDLDVPFPSRSGHATGIAVSGADVYIAGWVNGETGYSMPVLWKNGSVNVLSTINPGYQGVAMSVALSGGDVYVSGLTMSDDGAAIPCYWKNGGRQDLPVLDPDVGVGLRYNLINGAQAIAFGLAIDGDDVYVSGFSGSVAGGIFPAYWKNGSRIDLGAPEGTESDPNWTGMVLTDIAVIDGDVIVVAPMIFREPSGQSGSIRYWINGQPVDFRENARATGAAIGF